MILDITFLNLIQPLLSKYRIIFFEIISLWLDNCNIVI